MAWKPARKAADLRYEVNTNYGRRMEALRTVSEGDNLSPIAASTGTSEAAILAANPDVNRIQTGMVLNVPKEPGESEIWSGDPATPGFK